MAYGSRNSVRSDYKTSYNKSQKFDEDIPNKELEAAYLSVLKSTNVPIDSKKQLIKILQQAGRNPSRKQIDKFWTSNTDIITYEECIEMIRDIKLPSRDELLKAFRKFDLNGDGCITLNELRKALTSRGEKMTDSEVKNIFYDGDLNKDGKLDYAEFCTMMLSTSQQCQQENFKRLKKNEKQKSRPESASSYSSVRKQPQPAQRSNLFGSRDAIATDTNKVGPRPSSARKSSIFDSKSDNFVKLKFPAFDDRKMNLPVPKNLKTWNHVKSKGCLYLDNDDGTIICHHYLLELSSASRIWLTIKPYYLSQGQEKPTNPVDACMLILRRSASQNADLEFVGVTDLRDNLQHCWQDDLRAGSYVLVPYTSGCRLFRRRKEPDEEIQLIRKDQNNEIQLSRAFRETLSDMFEMCDLDGNGLLNRNEFNWFQLLTSDEEVDDEAWQVVQDNFEMKKNELTREGFIQLHLMQACEESVDTTEELQDTLQCMGYNKALDLDQACPFEVDVYAANSKLEMSVLTLEMGHTFRLTEKMLIKSILQHGTKHSMKNIPDVDWYVHKTDAKVSSVLENKSLSTVEIDVDCSQMKNCSTTKRKQNYTLQLVPNSSMLVDHVMAEDERREWIFACGILNHSEVNGSTKSSSRPSSSRPRSASKKSSISLF